VEDICRKCRKIITTSDDEFAQRGNFYRSRRYGSSSGYEPTRPNNDPK
jgi:hypothetical protein